MNALKWAHSFLIDAGSNIQTIAGGCSSEIETNIWEV